MPHYHAVIFTGRDHFLSVVRPFGAHKCAHELRQAGFNTLVIDHINHFHDTEIQNLIRRLVTQDTLFVGVSNTFLTGFCRQKLPYIKQQINKINPRCRLVLGGADSNNVDHFPDIDYLVIGYADLSLVNLAQHLSRGDALEKSHRSVHGYTVIDDTTAPDFDVQHSTMVWHDDDIIVDDRVLPLELSRGCIFRCAFCTMPLTGKKNGDYIRDADILRDELLRNYEKFGITAYHVLDDTFNDNRAKLDALESMVKTLPFSLQLWAYVRLDLLSKHPDTIDQLVRIGVRSMFFGIETLNQKSGRIIGKGYDPEKMIETIRSIKRQYKSRIQLHGHFIIGLPEESRESVLDVKSRMESNDIPLDSWVFTELRIRKKNIYDWDSAMGLDLAKYGYTDTGKPLPRNLVYWKNDHMDYGQALEIAGSSNNIDGRKLFEIRCMGYEFNHILARPYKFTHEKLEKLYLDFVARYKTHVMAYLDRAS